MVDPSLLRKNEAWLQTTYSVLDEMVSRGNLIADLRKSELQQLEDTLTRLHTTPASSNGAAPADSATRGGGGGFEGVATIGDDCIRDAGSSSHSNNMQFGPLQDWNSEEGLSGDQLIAVADSLDFTNLDWLSANPLGHLDGFQFS